MSAQTQGVPDQSQLVDVQPVSPIVSEPAANDLDPFHLSASLEDVDFGDEEGDENIPPPGPSWQVYPLPGVAASDIRRFQHDSFYTLFDRPTKRTVIALFEDHDDTPLPPVLLEGQNAISTQSHLPTPTPLISASSITRPFGQYNGPLSEIPLQYFLDEVSPKEPVESDSDVPVFELPPLVVSPGLRTVSEDDSNDL